MGIVEHNVTEGVGLELDLEKEDGVQVGKGVLDRGNSICKGWEYWQGMESWELGSSLG